MTKQIEYKRLPFYVKEIDEDMGIVTAVVAVMGNVDRQRDIIDTGAFKKTVAERGTEIKVLDNHNADSCLDVIANSLFYREIGADQLPSEVREKYPDATGGLLASMQYLLETEKGREIFYRIKSGAIDQYSIGYDAIKAVPDTVEVDGEEINVRRLKEIRLWEVSPVVFAANPATTTVAAKGDDSQEGANMYKCVECETTKDAGGPCLECGGETHEIASDDGSVEEKAITAADRTALTSELRGLNMRDLVATHRRLHQMAAQGNMLTGFTRADMNWFHGRVEADLRRRAEADERDPPEPTPLEWGSAQSESEADGEGGEEAAHFPRRVGVIRAREESDKGKEPPQNKAVNLTERVSDITSAFYTQYPDVREPESMRVVYWMREVWDTHVIVAMRNADGQSYWVIPYTLTDESVEFVPMDQWREVELTYVPVSAAETTLASTDIDMEGKAGRVLSQANANRIVAAVTQLVTVLEAAGISIPGFDEPEEEADDDKGESRTFSLTINYGKGGAGPDEEPPTQETEPTETEEAAPETNEAGPDEEPPTSDDDIKANIEQELAELKEI
jgi:HK97 family phage prohead protease